jgi:hypothetical protein
LGTPFGDRQKYIPIKNAEIQKYIPIKNAEITISQEAPPAKVSEEVADKLPLLLTLSQLLEDHGISMVLKALSEEMDD